ncbi:hypothetical protein SAMN04487760_1137 [Lachnospiraceae bacterium G41]|nr:hypothetical protein SAMN04487760_1137 [Lachnospiraceae bacterium G41]
MLKNILSENIDFIELFFIALSFVSAFLFAYSFFYEKSAKAFLKLLKIKKLNRRAKNEKKKVS